MTSGDLFHHWPHPSTDFSESQIGNRLMIPNTNLVKFLVKKNHFSHEMTLDKDLILSPQMNLGSDLK